MQQMTAGQLMDISGKPMVMLGGEWMYARHVSAGIVTEYTWQNGEPVMILYKDADMASSRLGAYMIELKDAHQYADANGNPSISLFAHACEAAVALGFDRMDRYAVRKIMDNILDGLPDLVSMPPAPKELEAREDAASHQGGELLFKIDGKTLFEGEV